MECTHARLLLTLAGRDSLELTASDRAPLDEHLEICSDCAALARSERLVDRALGRAMNAVPVPLALRAKILTSVARPRKPRYWPWISAAAGLLIALGLGGYWIFKPGDKLNFEMFVRTIDENANATRETVEGYFDSQGLSVAAPRQFRYAYLESVNVQMVQGQKVGHLLFHYPGDGEQGSAIAHVYILPTRFLEAEQQVRSRYPTSSHTVEFLPSPDRPEFVYMVVFTGSSLEPFIHRGNV